MSYIFLHESARLLWLPARCHFANFLSWLPTFKWNKKEIRYDENFSGDDDIRAGDLRWNSFGARREDCRTGQGPAARICNCKLQDGERCDLAASASGVWHVWPYERGEGKRGDAAVALHGGLSRLRM